MCISAAACCAPVGQTPALKWTTWYAPGLLCLLALTSRRSQPHPKKGWHPSYVSAALCRVRTE